ncbi:MAG: sensor domain-containing diguanylate cyclase [Candidatus Omnitrophota bacterium]|nr:sensor domain-containing diguanylate cyclase [Candidatus Omnitrophota bacterium]
MKWLLINGRTSVMTVISKRTRKNVLTKVELEGLFKKARKELAMLSEITNAMMRSLELDQVFYTILTALTFREGLGFDRAILFLVNEEKQILEGKMGIGPHSAEEADKVWNRVDDERLTLDKLLTEYDKFKTDPESKLNSVVKSITIPLQEDMGILALTILEGMPFEINSEEAKSRVNDEIKQLLNMDLFVTVPLKTKDRTLGVILVDNISSGKLITNDNMRILFMFADHAALAIENSRLYEKTVHLSQTDWLTGLWNARYLNSVLGKKLEKAEKEEGSLGLLLIDIDNFKRYNDTLGHQEGDKAIKRVAQLLTRHSRSSDFVCRYGGEEFCIVMDRIDKTQARIIAERFRSEVENSFKHDDSIPGEVKLTISLGLAIFPVDAARKETLISKADQALYRAKKAGKNRTSI